MREKVIAALAANRFVYTSEREFQDGIEQALAAAGIPFEREWPLSPADVPDFLCGTLAVEVKVKGSLADVTRQIHRYAQHDEVSEILLVTVKAAHTRVARSLGGKPVEVLFLAVGSAF